MTDKRMSSRQATDKRDDLNIPYSVRGPGTRAKAITGSESLTGAVAPRPHYVDGATPIVFRSAV